MSTSKSHSKRLEYLTPDDWTLINAKAKRLKFTLGQEIIRQGSVGTTLYIIRSGEAKVQLDSTKGRVTLAVLQSDEICGELAFLERGISNASVLASDDVVEVDAIQASDLRQLFESFSGLGARFYFSLAVVLARRLRETSAELAREVSRRNS